MKILVPLSGGVDSSYLIAKALEEGHEVLALILDNRSRAYPEILAARAICDHYQVPFVMAKTPHQKELIVQYEVTPHPEAAGQAAATASGLKYWSGFKGLLYALCLSFGAAQGYDQIWIGANAWNNHFADELPDRVQKFRTGWIELYPDLKMPTIEFPLMGQDKMVTIEKAKALHLPFRLTYSCGLDQVPPCGMCVSCEDRDKNFAAAGVVDPGFNFDEVKASYSN